MGLFDSVIVDCPHCGASVEIQVEGEECMNVYRGLDAAPDWILREAMNSPEHCRSCDGWLTVVDPRAPLQGMERPPATVRKVRAPEHPIRHRQGMAWWPDDQSFGPADLIKD